MTADAEAAEAAERNARRAAQYADEAAAAIQRARYALNNAAHAAGEAYEMLGRGRAASSDLNAQGQMMSQSEEPRRHLLNAESYTGDVGVRARNGEDVLRDIRLDLDRTRRELRTGRSAVVQLSRLPGQQSELADSLHDRLDRLEDVVHYADQRAVEVAGQLAVARGNIEPMAVQSRSGELQVTADTVRATGSQAGRNFDGAQENVSELGRDIGDVSSELTNAERESLELERHARAGLNPTTPAQRTEAGSAAEQEEATFHLRPGQADRQNTIGR